MNHFLKDRLLIADWLHANEIDTYTITDDLVVNVMGNVRIDTTELEYLPVQFGEVIGSASLVPMRGSMGDGKKGKLKSLIGSPRKVSKFFNCSRNDLRDLVGGPEVVGNDYSCEHNGLISLKGAPQKIETTIYCENNQLTSLIGGPQWVGRNYFCSNNMLVSLKGMVYVGDSIVARNNKLSSLEGSPQKIGVDFLVSANLLRSLEGGPSVVMGNYDCTNNLINTFDYLPQVVEGKFYCKENDEIKKLGLNIEYQKDFNGDYIQQSIESLKIIWNRYKLDTGLDIRLTVPSSGLKDGEAEVGPSGRRHEAGSFKI